MSQTPPEYGGCLWPLNPDCLGDEWTALSPEQQARAHALASATIARLTGYRVGTCPITVRPCRAGGYWNQSHTIPEYRPFFTPAIGAGGQWINLTCCSQLGCECEVACAIDLPRPVQGVTEVKVDGAVVDPANYYVSNNKVVWTGAGDCPFPASQDLGKPDTELGTFSITYLNSYPVDSVGACAVASLALEFAKSFTGAGKCRLPSNVRNVNRQGVSMELVVGAFTDGVTGLREVDSYIALWNPGNLRSGARVWTPDMARNR